MTPHPLCFVAASNTCAPALLIVIVAVVFTNVVGRYFFHAPLRWSDEVAQFLFSGCPISARWRH